MKIHYSTIQSVFLFKFFLVLTCTFLKMYFFLHQTKKLLQAKGNHKQYEKTTH